MKQAYVGAVVQLINETCPRGSRISSASACRRTAARFLHQHVSCRYISKLSDIETLPVAAEVRPTQKRGERNVDYRH